MPNATIQPAAIVVSAGISGVTLTAIPRDLYLYENRGLQATTVTARDLYPYENRGVQALAIQARDLYEYENLAIQALAILMRDLYGYEAMRDSPVTPWLLQLVPNEQFPLGAVDLYGDGLGQFTEVGAAATKTASSTNGSNIPANVSARSASTFWESNDGSGAWLRFTFGTAQTLYAIALEDLVNATTNRWGTPLFRFSDGGADVVGASPVPIPQSTNRTTEYPVGNVRTLYVLPAERTGITWVEVRVSSGGAGSARGLSQAWVYADQGQNAEGSVVDLIAEACGIVGTWLNRSPNWWPANSGIPPAKAVTFTVPSDGISGLVTVGET